MDKTALLMFSGGQDSFLSACRLLEQGYKVKLVTYTNGCTIEHLEEGSDYLIKRYGTDKVEYLGVHHIEALNREFYLPHFNMTTSELLQEFGEITISQLNCLICRTSMYIHSICLCKALGIDTVAEGARKCQLFVIELPGMINRYKALLNQCGLNYLLPVYDLESDWTRENELLDRGFTLPKTIEGQCLLGVPLDKPVPLEVIDGIQKFYDKAMLPRIGARKLLERKLTERQLRIKAGERYYI